MSENEIKPVDGAIPARRFEGQLWIPADVAIELRSKDRAAIDRLTADLKYANMAADAEADLADERGREIKRLKAERDAAVADAARYRWLRLRIVGREAVEDDFKWEYESGECLAQEVDAAIDAARAEGGV